MAEKCVNPVFKSYEKKNSVLVKLLRVSCRRLFKQPKKAGVSGKKIV